MRLPGSALSALALGVFACAPAAWADDCDATMAASRSIANAIVEGYTAITDKDAAAQAKALPKLEALFNSLPATEIKPQVCAANINTYTAMQYAELNFLRAHGIDSGFPTNLPIVKQPRLNHENLAYAVGWIKYEKSDFTGALAAFEKALILYPHSTEVQNEHLATLMQLQRYSDVLAAGEKYLSNTYDMTDTMRAKIFQALAIAQFSLGDKAAAAQSAQVAVYYDDNDGTRATQKQIADGSK